MRGHRFELDGGLVLILFLSFCQVNKASDAKFLGSQQRFSDSQMYDSYYCCNMCGSTLTWLVDNIATVVHFPPQSSVGSVENYQGTNTTTGYNSMILSRRNNSNEVCVDAVLIVSQTNPDWRPPVVCRGTTQQHIVDYADFTTNRHLPKEVRNNSVTAKSSLVQQGIVSPGSNYSTGAIVCRSNDGTISWKGNGRFIVTFNGGTEPGAFNFLPHPQDPTVALWETIVLSKKGQEITSVIVGTDFSLDNLSVSCHSVNYKTSFVINSQLAAALADVHTTSLTNTQTTTLAGTSTSPIANTRIIPPTTVAYAGSKQLTSWIFSVIGLATMLTST